MKFSIFSKEKRTEFILKLKNKYQLTIHNIRTLEEVFTFKLSRLNVFTYIGIFVIIIFILTGLLFVYTPLNLLLPNRHNNHLSRQLVENTVKLDSLEKEILVRDRYFNNIRNIMHGKQVDNYENLQDTSFKHEPLEFTRSKHDSILRKRIEAEEQQSLTVIENNTIGNVSLKNIHFFMPVKGIVTEKFSLKAKHFGIDIVSQKNEPVLATLEGTVTIATWSLTTGYIIQIQHANNLISIYKHNSELLKKEGDHVTAGETIAIIGNTGELTTGPHLHFELWHNGIVINPENYIAF